MATLIRDDREKHDVFVSYQTKCLVMLDQYPITIRDTGTSDLSPWLHIDRIVT